MQSQSSLALTRTLQHKTPTFEFTKRKRWADLLVSELTEAILLVLSPECHILYCGAAITDLLGWRDDELVDGDLAELINLDDRSKFQNEFRKSIQQRTEILAYARLRCKSEFVAHHDFSVGPKEVLFEINGYPHFIEGDNDCKCFFAAAKPYPSRNTAVLNTFLELKMENEYLQQRLSDLKLGNGVGSNPPSSIAGPSASVIRYDAGPAPMANQMSIRPLISRHNHISSPSSIADYPTMAYSVAPIHDDLLPSSTTRNFDSTGFKDRDEEGNSEPSRKKRKAFSMEQHVCVTCGRTDSPEWRKGPMGPKTLCNACGLRWAKKMRRFDDSEGGGGSPQDLIQSQFA